MERLKKYAPALAVAALGLLFLLLPTGRREETAPAAAGFSLAEEERRLAAALTRIPGAGEVHVLLAVAGSEERILAEDSREGSTTVKLAGSDAITRRTDYPAYTGAVVVATGSGGQVELSLTEAVRVFTGLSADKIKIICGGN